MSKSISNSFLPVRAFFWLGLVLVLSSLYPHGDSKIEHNIFTVMTAMSYVFCLVNWCKNCRFISLYVFFVLYCLFSNIGQSILFVFQVPEEFLSCYFYHSLIEINLMLRFQASCIAALNFGTCLFVRDPIKCVKLEEQQQWYKRTVLPGKDAPSIMTAFLYIAMITAVVTMTRMVIMKSTMNYADFFEAGRGQGKGLLHRLYLYYLLICVVYFTVRYDRKVLIFFVVGGMVVVQLLTGARGLSLPYIGALMIVLPITNPELFKKRYWFLWLVVVVLFFSSIGLLSSIRSETLSQANVSYEGSVGTNVLNTMSEMGYTERTSILTIDAIDNNSNDHHQTILITIIKALIPFSSQLGWVSGQYISLGEWVSKYGGSYHSGLGYSCIAEAYMNYGKVGWIFFMIYGYFICYAENTAYRRMIDGKYLYALLLILFLCNMIVYARGQFAHSQEIIRFAEYCFIGWLIIKEIKK